MNKKAAVPDAWDDDWESQADKEDAITEVVKPVEEVKITKKERLAQHAESQKKIWDSAEEPETFHFLAAKDNVPLKQEFKGPLKMLSRKPTPQMIQRVDPVTGLTQMSLEDENEEEELKKVRPTPEQLRLKAQKEREEKQRKYDEARARILGPSGSALPGSAAQPADSNRGKGRGRGNGRQDNQRPSSQSGTKELFDPNHTPKSGISIQRRSGNNTPKDEDSIIRTPRGPDSSGRGGFGFANRGGKLG